MSRDPEKRNKDAKESAKDSIKERPEPLVDMPNPTEPVKVSGTREEKGADAGL